MWRPLTLSAETQRKNGMLVRASLHVAFVWPQKGTLLQQLDWEPMNIRAVRIHSRMDVSKMSLLGSEARTMSTSSSKSR